MNLLVALLTVIGTLDAGGDFIKFYNEQGECSDGWHRVDYTLRQSAGGSTIPGCFKVIDDQLAVLFADGDRGLIPVKVVKWEPGKRPVKL